MSHAAPNLLPGEVRPHPDPCQYVVVAVVLVVITAVEIGVSYIEGDIPDGLIVVLLLAMMVVKFFLVASWFMHLRTDQPVFKRFFIVGCDRRRRSSTSSCWRRCTRPGRLSRGAADAGAVAVPDAGRRTPTSGCWSGCSPRATRSASIRLGPALAAAGLAGRHPLPGHVLVARGVRDVGGVRLPDPRHRRALQLQRPHGAAPASSPWSWRRCCCSGMPAWLLRRLLCAPRGCSGTVRTLSRFIPALLIFNVVLVFTHWPLIVERGAALRARALPHPRAAARVVADRVDADREPAARDPAPRAGDADALPVRCGRSCRRCPASFLTFGASPLYKFYERVPHLFGLSTLEDQQTAGLIMKIGAGLLLWAIIAVVFFRWASEEERANTPAARARRDGP